MFTGIIREMGRIVSIVPSGTGRRLIVAAPRVSKGVLHGDSVAVDGLCLSVVKIEGDRLFFDVTPESLLRGIGKTYHAGTRVNLETAMGAVGKFDGHVVQGHVDAVGTFLGWKREGNAYVCRFRYPGRDAGYLVEKGSIAVNGVSLTVMDPGSPARPEFTVSVIPITWEETTLALLKRSAKVNLEYDIMGKYVHRQAGMPLREESNLTIETLRSAGYVE